MLSQSYQKTASIINKKDEVKIKKDIITLDTHPIRNKEKTIKNDNLYLAPRYLFRIKNR